jgi:predicted type IV restriction endonuclease
MSLESTLADIIARLRQGRFPNGQAISQGIVLRVLQELGWDICDTTLVWPEFQTGEGRADFALCHPPSKPPEFIEAKPPAKNTAAAAASAKPAPPAGYNRTGVSQEFLA